MQGPVQVACSPALFFFLQTRYAFIFVRSSAALFERLRSPPGNDELTLEHSIRHKTAKAGISLILLLPTRRRKTSHKESARLSKILSNQQDSLEPARLPQISKIPSNRTDSLSDSRPPNPADIRPRLHVIEPYLPTAIHSRGLSRVASSVIKRHIGLSRVRVESLVGPGPLFIDCS